MCKSPVRESKRPTRRSRVKKCPVDTFLGRGRVEISKIPAIVREKLRQRQKGLGGHHEKFPYGNRRGAPGVNFGGQWPQPISHGSFLRIVTSLTRPVSAACPPNLLHIPFSLFPESARYCYRVEIDAKTQAPLAKGGWFCLWQNRGDSAGWQVSTWVCTIGKMPAANPSVKNQRFLPAPFGKGAFGVRKMGALQNLVFATLPLLYASHPLTSR